MNNLIIDSKRMQVPAVMCVDGDRDQLEQYGKFLSGNGFNVDMESDPVEAILRLDLVDPYLILVDIEMPRMRAFQFMETLCKMEIDEPIPVIMVSGRCTDETIRTAYQSGAVDFIRKPFVREEMVNRVKLQIENVMIKRINSMRFEKMEIYMKDQLDEITNIKNTTIFSMAKIAESRDPETGAHLERIREYARELATEMARKDRYSDRINHEFIYNIYNMSILHDIGKVGIPDSILLKPGKLTDEEYSVMKTHTTIGGKALEDTVLLNRNSAFLEMGEEIAYYHHEKWDGTGYPKGLKGEAIPLAARITALADVYDAVSYKRVYRNFAMKDAEIDEIMEKECGRLFDPDIYGIFKGIKDKFQNIKLMFA